MAKKNRGRRKNSKHYSDSDDENETLSDHGKDKTENSDSKYSKNARSKSDLSFAERREVQRKAAAEKRRQKMKVRKMIWVELLLFFEPIAYSVFLSLFDFVTTNIRTQIHSYLSLIHQLVSVISVARQGTFAGSAPELPMTEEANQSTRKLTGMRVLCI